MRGRKDMQIWRHGRTGLKEPLTLAGKTPMSFWAGMRRSLEVLLAAILLFGSGTAFAQNLQTTGPSLNTDAFQQVDDNGVDLINGTFNVQGPSVRYGDGDGRLSVEMRWNGRMWALNSPSIWRDDDNSLFVNNGRATDEFERVNGNWVPARGNSSRILCLFYDQANTQMRYCDYTGHDGSTVHFEAFNPVIPPADAFAPEGGNLNARIAYAIYPDGRASSVVDSGLGQFNVGLNGGIAMLGNGGAGGPGTWSTSVDLTLSITASNGFGNPSTGRTIGQLTINTPGLNYNNRRTRNIFRPYNTTQTIIDPNGQTWSYTFNTNQDLTGVRRPGQPGEQHHGGLQQQPQAHIRHQRGWHLDLFLLLQQRHRHDDPHRAGRQPDRRHLCEEEGKHPLIPRRNVPDHQLHL